MREAPSVKQSAEALRVRSIRPNLNVSGNGGRTCELSVAVHTANSIVHVAVELLFLIDDAVLNIGQITYQYLQPKS